MFLFQKKVFLTEEMKLLSVGHLKQVARTSNLLLTSTRNMSSKDNTKKTFTQQDFDEINDARMEASREELIKNNSDPFIPLKKSFKAVGGAFLLATLCSVGYGAYDQGYRKTLRTTYPLAAGILDMVMEKEVQSVLDQEVSSEKASIFREEFKDGYKP